MGSIGPLGIGLERPPPSRGILGECLPYAAISMPRTPLRIGLIGSGMMCFEHTRNVALQDEMKIVALADPNLPSREFGRKTAGHPGVAATDSIELGQPIRLGLGQASARSRPLERLQRS